MLVSWSCGWRAFTKRGHHPSVSSCNTGVVQSSVSGPSLEPTFCQSTGAKLLHPGRIICKELMNAEFVSFAHGARVLGIDPRTLDKLVRKGEIHTIRISPTRRRLNLHQLTEW